MQMRSMACLGALALAVYGCGEESTPSGPAGNSTGGSGGTLQPGAGPVSLDGLAHEVGIAMCNLILRCMSGALDPSYQAETCVAGIENTAGDQLVAELRAGIASGRLVYDEAAMRACLDAYPQFSCDYANEASLAGACTNAMRGTVPQGGECEYDLECADNLTTALCASTGTCPGHCGPRGSLGDSCENDSDCLLTLACAPTATCQNRLLLGDPCGETGDTGDCGGLTTCQVRAGGTGTCQLPAGGLIVPEGQACDSDARCERGFVCTVTGTTDGGQPSAQCEKPAVSGGPCRFASSNPCPEGEYCPVSLLQAETTTGTCTRQRGPNESCDSSITEQCQAGTICSSNGTCAALQRIGSPCTDEYGCYSFTCTSGSCAAVPDCAS